MLLRFGIKGNLDYCIRTHISVTIGDRIWAPCGVFPRSYTDEEISEKLNTPEELNNVTILYQGEADGRKRRYQ